MTAHHCPHQILTGLRFDPIIPKGYKAKESKRRATASPHGLETGVEWWLLAGENAGDDDVCWMVAHPLLVLGGTPLNSSNAICFKATIQDVIPMQIEKQRAKDSSTSRIDRCKQPHNHQNFHRHQNSRFVASTTMRHSSTVFSFASIQHCNKRANFLPHHHKFKPVCLQRTVLPPIMLRPPV